MREAGAIVVIGDLQTLCAVISAHESRLVIESRLHLIIRADGKLHAQCRCVNDSDESYQTPFLGSTRVNGTACNKFISIGGDSWWSISFSLSFFSCSSYSSPFLECTIEEKIHSKSTEQGEFVETA